MEERRKSKRWYLIYPIRVCYAENDQFMGFLENISRDGLMVKCGQSVTTNSLYQLKILCGQEIHQAGYYAFPAECKWWERDISTGFYEVGFLLEDLSARRIQIFDKIASVCCGEKSF